MKNEMTAIIYELPNPIFIFQGLRNIFQLKFKTLPKDDKKRMPKFKLTPLAILTPLLLAACSGGGGSETGSRGEGISIKQKPNVIQVKNWDNYKQLITTSNERIYYILSGAEALPSNIGDEKQGDRDYSVNVNNRSTYQDKILRAENLSLTVQAFANIIASLNKVDESYYVYSKDQGQFSKDYILAQTNALTRTQPTKVSELVSKVALTEAKLNFTEQADTSFRWTKNEINNAFAWDRLERDRTMPVDNLTNKQGIILDNKPFEHLVNEDVKVLAVDSSLSNKPNIDFSRVEVEYFYSDPDPATNADLHGDATLYTMMGIPYDNNYSLTNKTYLDHFSDWHEKGTQLFHPNFLSQKGKIFLAGDKENRADGKISGAVIMASNLVQRKIDEGYDIINGSYSFNIENSAKLKQRLKDNPTLSIHEAMLAEGLITNHIPEYIKNIANKDVLWVTSAGNSSNANYSKETQYSHLYKDLLGNHIVATALDTVSGSISDYSNHCRNSKEFCLAAPGNFVQQYKDGSFQPIGEYSIGTSIAAPYISGTAALVKSVFPWMGGKNLSTTLLTTAKDLGEKGVDEVYGWGLIQPHVAVNGPKQFIWGDFVANLSNNSQNLKNTTNRIYRFSNDISGNYGLTVKADHEVNNVLSLSGHNTYKGDTNVENRAILNIDGINENQVNVKYGASLYGSGKLDGLKNEGNVFNYSYFTKTNPNDLRSQYGMVIEGNYEQTHTGVLTTILGQPLMVKGYAMLDGWLNVEGIKNAFVSKYGKVFNDVVVAKKGMSGKFQYVTVPDSLTNPTVKYNSMNTGDGALYTATVFADYVGQEATTQRLVEKYSANEVAIENAKALENAINNKLEQVVSQDKSKSEAEVAEEYLASVNSSLVNMVGELQNNTENASSVLNALEGKTFTDIYRTNFGIQSLNDYNLLKNTLNDTYLNATYEQTAKEMKGNQAYLNAGFTEGNWKLHLQVQQGSHDKNGQRYKNYGGNAVVGYQFGKVGFNALVGHDEFKFKLGDYLKTTADTYGMFVDVGAKYDNHQFRTYLGTEVTKFTNKQHSDGVLTLSKQSKILPYMFVGANYRYQLNDWTLGLDYHFKRSLKDGSFKLKGELNDGVFNSNALYKVEKENIHIAKLTLDKSFGNWTVGANAGLIKGKKTSNQFGLNLKYNF